MPPPQTYTTYTYRPRRTTSETAKFQAANIQLAGGWWMTKQSYHNLPSHKRLDTHARAVGATRRTGVISGFAAASLLGRPSLPHVASGPALFTTGAPTSCPKTS